MRQHGLPAWEPAHPALMRFKKLRCASLAEFRRWVADECKRAKEKPADYGVDTDPHGQARTGHAARLEVRGSPCSSVTPQVLPAVLAANSASRCSTSASTTSTDNSTPRPANSKSRVVSASGCIEYASGAVTKDAIESLRPLNTPP